MNQLYEDDICTLSVSRGGAFLCPAEQADEG